MDEREQRWREVEAQIICPFKVKPELCRKSEGVREEEKYLSHTAIIFTAECNFCDEKASGWGSR